MPTFQITATPVTVEQRGGYSTYSFLMFRHPSTPGEITVSSPGEVGEMLAAWAYSTPLPTVTDWDSNNAPVNAWAVAVVKPKRWPNGYKQAGERTRTFVVA